MQRDVTLEPDRVAGVNAGWKIHRASASRCDSFNRPVDRRTVEGLAIARCAMIADTQDSWYGNQFDLVLPSRASRACRAAKGRTRRNRRNSGDGEAAAGPGYQVAAIKVLNRFHRGRRPLKRKLEERFIGQ